MSTTDGQTESRESFPAPPPMPELPDGIGMSLDQVTQMLAQKHKTIVSVDDPLLMMVTICNAFLAEEEKLLQRHNQALTEVLSARVDDHVRAVEKISRDLSTTLAGAAVTGIQDTYHQFRLSMVWLAGIIATSAVVNVAVFVFSALYRK